MKIRIVKNGGMKLWQIITNSIVLTLSHNLSKFNGKIGWTIGYKVRKQTNL